MIRIALFQPDIPQNTGTLLRLGACFNVDIHVIGPAGFRLDDKALKRAAMDYHDQARLILHADWTAFSDWRAAEGGRLLLFTTHGAVAHTAITHEAGDILLFGRESAGAPPWLHEASDARICIPTAAGTRSLNVAVAAAIATGEALRQLNAFPPLSA